MTEIPAGRRPGPLRRWLPPVCLVVAIGLAFAFGLDDYLTLDALGDNRERLLEFVAAWPLVAPLAFMAIYIVAVALSLPGATAMTVAGGFLFGTVQATGLVVVAATIGATVLFLVARSSLGAALHERAGPWIKRLEAGFHENEMSYMLVLRLVPLFPFFVVNLVPAFLDVRTRTFVIATLFGIIPGTFVYASVGGGLGSVFDTGGEISLAGVLTPEVLLALLGLAALALIPVVYRYFRSR